MLVITPKRFRWICLLLAFAALGLRLPGLAEKSVDIDEISTYQIGKRLNRQTLEGRPPLSFVLIAAALKIRDSQTMLLLPAVLFGAASVGLLGWTGRVAFGWRAGLLAGLLILFSPYHIRFSQYARYYSFMVFFSLLSYLYLDLWVRMRRWRYLALWCIPAALNLASHFFAAFVVGIQAGIVGLVLVGRMVLSAWKERSVLKLSFMLLALVSLVVGGWVAYSVTGLEGFVHRETTATYSWDTPGVDVSWAFWREYFETLTCWPRGWMPVALVLFALGGVVAWRRNKLFLFHTVALLTVPIVVVDYMQPRHFFDIKYVAFSLPFYLMGLAAGLAAIWRAPARWLPAAALYRWPAAIVAAAIVLAAPLLVVCTYATVPVKREFRDLVQYVERVSRPDDLVLVTTRLDRARWQYFASPEQNRRMQMIGRWEDIEKQQYLRRFAQPFWLVMGKVQERKTTETAWMLNTFSHQAFERGYLLYSQRHARLDLTDSAVKQARCERPRDLPAQVGVGQETFRFALYVPRSWHYYVIVSSSRPPRCLARFETGGQRRWVRPKIQPASEHDKVWLAEGIHDLTLMADKGVVGNLKDFRLLLAPAGTSTYKVNATHFDGVEGPDGDKVPLTRFDLQPTTDQGRTGVEMWLWGYLLFPVVLERGGRYECTVTADNDRPATNVVEVFTKGRPIYRFDFNKRNNSIESQRGIIRLPRGFQVLKLRNRWYRSLKQVRLGPVRDSRKTVLFVDFSLRALDKPETERR